MATVTVRGLDDEVRRRLKIRAAAHDRSMEAEVRAILSEAVTPHEEAPRPPVPDSPACPDQPVLSAREQRVAELVAQGLTNRQIASCLYLSERTVESHVSAILRKLGCHHRATVASWYTAHPCAPADSIPTVVPRMPAPPAHH